MFSKVWKYLALYFTVEGVRIQIGVLQPNICLWLSRETSYEGNPRISAVPERRHSRTSFL